MSSLDFSHLSPEDLRQALEGPALSPPDGVSPNFDDPPNQNAAALAGLLALYLSIVVGSFVRISSPASFFVHQWDIRGRDIKKYLFDTAIGTEFGLVTILLIKSSILLEWIHLFASTSNQPFALCCKIVIAVNIACFTTALIALNVTCRPFQKTWDKTVEGTCDDVTQFYLSTVIINLVLDLAILVLPQPVIWGLQMTSSRKLGVSAVFTCGILGLIAAAFLLGAVVDWIHTGDMTYYYSSVALWSVAETTCGIMIFSVPFVPRFLRDISSSKASTNVTPLHSTSTRRGECSGEHDSEMRSARRISKHDYLEVQEVRRTYGSPRPTDRQYGIAVTTDIIVTTYQPDEEQESPV
ncbi:hypothetical protein GGS21DRAFT_489887 [Xylaria nigripes]|nr:hypothetical protein GGS21DRAFT_489887 [Xylaria nigripes]